MFFFKITYVDKPFHWLLIITFFQVYSGSKNCALVPLSLNKKVLHALKPIQLSIYCFFIGLKMNFIKPQIISTHLSQSDNLYFHFFYQLSNWVLISWGFHEIIFQTDTKNFNFLSWKPKKFYSWKKKLASI